MSHSWPFPPSPWLFSWSSGVLVSPYVNLSVFRSWAERTKRSRGRACFCLWASLCGIMTTSPPLFSHFDHLSWSCPVISRQKSSTNHPGQIWCLSQNCEGVVKISKQSSFSWRSFLTFHFVWPNYNQGCCPEGNQAHLSRPRQSFSSQFATFFTLQQPLLRTFCTCLVWETENSSQTL